MTDHTAMLNRVADDLVSTAINHPRFAVDPEAVLYMVRDDMKHNFGKITWAETIRPPLGERTLLHEFKHRILKLSPRERNAPEIEAIASALLTERQDPQHYLHGGGKER